MCLKSFLNISWVKSCNFFLHSYSVMLCWNSLSSCILLLLHWHYIIWSKIWVPGYSWKPFWYNTDWSWFGERGVMGKYLLMKLHPLHYCLKALYQYVSGLIQMLQSPLYNVSVENQLGESHVWPSATTLRDATSHGQFTEVWQFYFFICFPCMISTGKQHQSKKLYQVRHDFLCLGGSRVTFMQWKEFYLNCF